MQGPDKCFCILMNNWMIRFIHFEDFYISMIFVYSTCNIIP